MKTKEQLIIDTLRHILDEIDTANGSPQGIKNIEESDLKFVLLHKGIVSIDFDEVVKHASDLYDNVSNDEHYLFKLAEANTKTNPDEINRTGEMFRILIEAFYNGALDSPYAEDDFNALISLRNRSPELFKKFIREIENERGERTFIGRYFLN